MKIIHCDNCHRALRTSEESHQGGSLDLQQRIQSQPKPNWTNKPTLCNEMAFNTALKFEPFSGVEMDLCVPCLRTLLVVVAERLLEEAKKEPGESTKFGK